ncbi:hypothetical protein EDD11_008078 [Mortierella claussenii]|nr:hypothetical protein EDD11_008078 [Mortierella claussenii]
MASSSMLWHSVPGRLQSVSVADKLHIWGVTLDLQLCRFDPQAQQWQLVAVTSESVNRSRFSSSSAHSASSNTSHGTSSSLSAAVRPGSADLSSSLRSKSSWMPAALGLGVSSTLEKNNGMLQSRDHRIQHQDAGTASAEDGMEATDGDAETTIQVSAASDGTVVRLDKTQRSWYLIAPHQQCEFEKDVIWVNMGHLWKCVSVASVAQIWGLNKAGKLFYGNSDHFVELEYSITSGVGSYSKPNFTHISVGHDNVVLATDAYSGTVFRLKTHPTASHPPIWIALPGTGSDFDLSDPSHNLAQQQHGSMSGNTLHMVSCELSTTDYIVGVALSGHVYRFCNNHWVPMGCGTQLSSVGVGVDGYVLGVDRDGDLFGCQLESALVIPRRVSSRSDNSDSLAVSKHWMRQQHTMKDQDESSSPSSPQAPNLPNNPMTPRVQAASQRPVASPRELFEMITAPSSLSIQQQHQRDKMGSLLSEDSDEYSPISSFTASRSDSYSSRRNKSRGGLERSDSELSKKSSYASDIGSAVGGLSPLAGLRNSQATSEAIPAATTKDRNCGPVNLFVDRYEDRDENKQLYGSSSKPATIIGATNDAFPANSRPVDGNPYSTESQASSQLSNLPKETPVSFSSWDRLQPTLLSAKVSAASSMSSTSAAAAAVIAAGQATAAATRKTAATTPVVRGLRDPGYMGDKQEIEAEYEAEQEPSNDSMKSHLRNRQEFFGTTASRERKQGTSVPGSRADSNDARLSEGCGDSGNQAHQLLHSDHHEPDIHSSSINSGDYWSPGQLSASIHQGTQTGYRFRPPGESEWIKDKEKAEILDPFFESSVDMNRGAVSQSLASRYHDLDRDEGKQDHDLGRAVPVNLNKADSHQDKEEWIEANANNDHYELPSIYVPSATDPSQHLYQQTPTRIETAYPPPKRDRRDLDPDFDYQTDVLPSHPPPTALLASHRPSDSSDVLMLQQQEFLRLTRLSSNPASASSDIANQHFGQSKDLHPNFSPYNDYLIADDQAPSAVELSPARYVKPLQTTSSQPLPLGFHQRPDHDDNIGLISRRRIGPQVITGTGPGSAVNWHEKGGNDEVTDHPSYSSSHLQHYVDMTLADNMMNSGSTSRNRRTFGLGTDPGATASPEMGLGIQGEDIQGRWVAGSASSNAAPGSSRVSYYDGDVHKSKCCLIL